MTRKELKSYLDQKVEEYNVMGFIDMDPISIPHRFSKKQDIEIAAFLAATFAWGQRKTIINKCNHFIELMDDHPYDFILNHQISDRKRFLDFKHRTFNATDALYFIDFLQRHYRNHDSLESAFVPNPISWKAKEALTHFKEYFFDCEYAPERTSKHVASPAKKSTCKRLNMFLRWMVRKDGLVDFGLWENIPQSELMMPLDVHVGRVARHYKLLKRKQNDWTTVEELTKSLKKFDSEDPVKYDFALFSLGEDGTI